jgi:uncharacterized protein DUF2188
MAQRAIFHVTPFHNGWQVKGQGAGEFDQEAVVDTKDRAVELARERAKSTEPSQVIIHKQDGVIETEYTYGDDPRDIPG